MKNTIHISVVISLFLMVSIGVYHGFSSSSIYFSSKITPMVSEIKSLAINTTEANPDYICIKQVENGPCADLDNPSWNGSSTRVRTGNRVTSVAYYSVRIGCAEGGEAQYIGEAGGASGRRSADFPYAYGSSCTVIESDVEAPDSNPVTN